MTKGKKTELDEILRRPYTIELEYGETPEAGVAAYVVEWPGCITAGDTRAEALSRIEDAMAAWAEFRLEAGLDIPEPLGEFGGRILLRVPKSLHRDIVRVAEHEGVSVNQWLSATIAKSVGSTAVDSVAEARGRYVASRRRGRVR